MPIPASVLYPAMLAAADNPDLLDTLLELSQDVDTLPEALLSPDDPEFHAAHRRLANRLRDHLGWIDDDLEEAIDAVSLSDFPVTASQQILKLEESQHRYATTQFLLPDDISTSVRRLADSISDDVLTHTGREQRPHITVKYGLQGDPEMVRQAVENYGPVHVRLGKTSLFPAGGTQSGYEVVKIDVDSDDLHGLNRVICDAIPHVNTHPTYHPHVTLGYVQPGMGGNYAGLDALDGTEVLLNELVFSDATKQETRISLGEGKKIHPTAKVDEVLAVISAAREGDADVTAEELAGLMQGLSQDDIEKVKAVYGGDVVEGKGGCQSCGKQLWEGMELLSDDEDPVEDELTEAEVKGKGYTGALKDKNGRIYCLNKGKRVKCSEADLAKAKEEFKDASSPDVSTEKPETPKQPKPEKPTTDSAHEQIQSLLKAEVNDDTITQIASALKSLTVKDITEIKQKLGLKASGKKEELIQKIAQKAVEGARKAKESKPVEPKPAKDEKSETVTREPETPPEQSVLEPQQTTSSPTREFQKTVIAKAKDAGDFIPISIADMKRDASPEQRKQIDASLLEMINSGILVPVRHNHPGILPENEKAMLLKNPDKNEYYVDVSYIPEDSRAGYSVDGKWISDDKFLGSADPSVKQEQPAGGEKPQEDKVATPQQSSDVSIRDFQKDVIAKAKDAGDFIPISIADMKKNATPEQRKQIDNALWEMIDKGIVFPAKHNHPGILPQEQRDLLLLHPNGKDYFVDVGYIPEENRAGYSADGKWTTDEKFFSQQHEPKSDTPESSPSNTLSPLTNSLQSLRDNGGSQDDFLALGLNKLPVKELAKVAGELGVTSKDNSKTGLIRAIQRHVLEKPGEVNKEKVADPEDDLLNGLTDRSEQKKDKVVDSGDDLLNGLTDPTKKTPDDIVLADEDEITLDGDSDKQEEKTVVQSSAVPGVPAPKFASQKEAHGHISRIVSEGLTNSKLSREQKKQYASHIQGIVNRMPKLAQQYMASHLQKIDFCATLDELEAKSDEYLKDKFRDPKLVAKYIEAKMIELKADNDVDGMQKLLDNLSNPEGYKNIMDAIASHLFTPGKSKGVAGKYYTGRKMLLVDGGSDKLSKSGKFGFKASKDDAAEVYAHELGHAIDGKEIYSGSSQWQEVFKNEICKPPINSSAGKYAITHYSMTNEAEGFAETCRLLYTGQFNLKDIETNLPQTAKFFKDNGLWPVER